MEKTIGIFDNETGEQIVRAMNAQELEEDAIFLADIERKKLEIADAIEAKEAAKAKLAALGLTSDDLKAIGL
jgi:hypothetical protein